MDLAGLVGQKPLVIFSKSSCCMSHTIKQLMHGFGAKPTVYEIDEIPNGQQIERELVQRGCCPSVPAVFIGQQLVGGANEILRLHVRNDLAPLLIRANAIWVWNKK